MKTLEWSSRLWLTRSRRLICFRICLINSFFFGLAIETEFFWFFLTILELSVSCRISWLKGERPGTRTLAAYRPKNFFVLSAWVLLFVFVECLNTACCWCPIGTCAHSEFSVCWQGPCDFRVEWPANKKSLFVFYHFLFGACFVFCWFIGFYCFLMAWWDFCAFWSVYSLYWFFCFLDVFGSHISVPPLRKTKRHYISRLMGFCTFHLRLRRVTRWLFLGFAVHLQKNVGKK